MLRDKKGTRSHEAASNDYVIGLSRRLRCLRGWHKDALALLFQEYDAFERQAAAGDFAVQSMWDYARLAEVSDWYLHDNGSRHLPSLFRMKISQGLMIIDAQRLRFRFDERELESMRMATERLKRAVGWWKAPEEARE